MFTAKGLFSEIPCPHAAVCVLPRCMFSHAPLPTQVVALPTISPALYSDVDFEENVDSDRRKRRKLDTTADVKAPNGQRVLVKSPLRSSPARRPVSPPPLKRAVESTQKPISKPTVPNITAATIVQKPTALVRSAPQAVRKEDLNPRMIKASPASHDLRFKLLKALHDQLVRLNNELANDASSEEELLVLSDQQLITMALDAEESAAIGKPSIYGNVFKNKILVYKRMMVKEWKAEREAEKARVESALPASIGVEKVARKPSEPPKPIETGLNHEQEKAFLNRLLTPLEGLSKHGYVTEMPTAEEIIQAKEGLDAAHGWEVCDRCKARFQVFPGRREEDGALTTGGSCTYHWGKPYWQERSKDDPKAKREKRFRCCYQSMGDSAGCTTSDCHVFKISEVKRLAAVLQFAETPATGFLDPKNKADGPVCIDGEMGYTVYGLELIRVTATSWPSGDALFDVLVRPVGEILDLNSRWSGVWPEQYSSATPWDPTSDKLLKHNTVLPIVPSPVHARTLLFNHLTPTTPLIGHGLENDLNSLRVIHPTIIDTVFLFPHRAGLPYRNGLKTLMQQHLGRSIQTANSGGADAGDGAATGGHDSKEDARAAGDLVRWKVAVEWEGMKRAGWDIDAGGQLVPPKARDGRLGGLSVGYLEGEGEGGPNVESGSSNSLYGIRTATYGNNETTKV